MGMLLASMALVLGACTSLTGVSDLTPCVSCGEVEAGVVPDPRTATRRASPIPAPTLRMLASRWTEAGTPTPGSMPPSDVRGPRTASASCS